MGGSEVGSPEVTHTHHKSHHRSHHKRKSPADLSNEQACFIKPEPVDDDVRTSKVKRENSRSYDDLAHRGRRREHRPREHSLLRSMDHSSGGRRLREPLIIKQESPDRRRRRLHSPRILRDGDEVRRENDRRRDTSDGSDARPDFRTSGLLNNDKEAPGSAAKQRANFGLSGKLTEDTNTYKGVVIKYNEPPDARKPTEHWRLYAFKGNKSLPILHIHRQSGFLIGRDRKIADIPMDHPSISKQHAVLQYRFVRGLVRLYLIDLESVNGTYLNNKRIEARRYYELLEQDVIKFGYSTREYVVMTDELHNSDDDEGEKHNSDRSES